MTIEDELARGARIVDPTAKTQDAETRVREAVYGFYQESVTRLDLSLLEIDACNRLANEIMALMAAEREREGKEVAEAIVQYLIEQSHEEYNFDKKTGRFSFVVNVESEGEFDSLLAARYGKGKE